MHEAFTLRMCISSVDCMPSFLSQMERQGSDSDYRRLLRMNNRVIVEAEIRLLFVPLVFVFLRVWDVMDGIIFVYHPSPSLKSNYHWLQPLTVSVTRMQPFKK